VGSEGIALVPYTAITLATLRNSLQARWEGSVFWTDQEAREGLNESLHWWNLLTGQWKRTEILPTLANQVWYPLSSTLVYTVQVQFGSLPMDQTSVEDLDNGRAGWEGETTASGSPVPSRPTCWAPAGLKSIAIWPADAVGGVTMVVDGVRATPTLVADTDYLDLGQEELDTLLGETLHRLTFKEGGKRLTSTLSWHKDFIAAAMAKNSRLSASALFRQIMGQDVGRAQAPFAVGPGKTVQKRGV
jgi:hypothetical protein